MMRIEALCDGYEFGSMTIKEIHQDMKILDGSGQAIDFIGQDAGDPASANILQ